MAKIKIELNHAAINNLLLKGSEITSYCEDVARARLPEGCEINTQMGKNRAIVEIKAVTDKAIQDNLENNTLLKAVSR